MGTGHDHTWFVLTQKIIEKEFALSGSEQNPDITGRDLKQVLTGRLGSGAPAPVEAFKRHGADFVVERELPALVRGMNALTDEPLIDLAALEREIVARDRELANPYAKDLQITAIHGARRFLADRVTRIAAPHRILDPEAGPLIAVKLHILTRKTLGGLQTDLSGRVLQASGEPLAGLYAAGEVAGFGGGGMHGYRALEGTFLGGCLFSGRSAGRAARGRHRVAASPSGQEVGVVALELLGAFVLIVGGAIGFTNAVEWLGHRLDLGQGAVGALLAAVGTALPESVIPIVALVSGGGGHEAVEIAIGAIIGAPFVLGTLAMLVIAGSALAFRGRREQGSDVATDASSTRRDLLTFLAFFPLGILAGALDTSAAVQIGVAVVLVAGYGALRVADGPRRRGRERRR